MKKNDSSFRDPNGFIFTHEGTLYRQVNNDGRSAYDLLISSGLYESLARKGWLITHKEVDSPAFYAVSAYRILKPELIPFVSYPYEWSFSQLKDAAVLTLDIQLLAIKHGMVLRDASAYNIQFKDGKPVLIDTLSLGVYEEGAAWEGYRQFCQHFLAPLVLMSKQDIRLSQLSKVYIDGVPLDLASALLPAKTWLMPSLLMHIHLHAKAQRAYSGSENPDNSQKKKLQSLSRNGLMGIVLGLRRLIKKLDWKPAGTEWADYYQKANYSDNALLSKTKNIDLFLDEMRPKSVWDIGANAGLFSRLASKRGIQTIAFDIDPSAVEVNYRSLKETAESSLLPLVMDITNPSASIGWGNAERSSFMSRGSVDCVFALALIHHLAISNNVPLAKLADFFALICTHLIIEFVPKSDSQVRRLLSSRKDIFYSYTEQGFEDAFSQQFEVRQKLPVMGSDRMLYWLIKRQ